MPRTTYLDASALVKLVVPEAESEALRASIATKERLVSSRLGATEFRRACAGSGRREFAGRVDAILERIVLLDVSSDILDAAGRLEPRSLRTLDAIHVATALSVRADDVDVITYDDRMARAARRHGLTVEQPS